MKICLFTDCYFPNIGGAEIVVHQLAKEFLKKGHDVYVIAPARWGLQREKFPYKILPYPPIPGALVHLRVIVQALFFLFYHFVHRFEVVNIHKTYSGYSLSFIKSLVRVPFIITAHGGDIQSEKSINYGRRIEEPEWEPRIRRAVQSAHKLVAISRESKDCFLDLGAREKQIVQIPNGADLERFSTPTSVSKKDLFATGDDFIILAVGRYHIKKGYEYLIQSLKYILKEVPNARLVIIGKQSPLLTSLAAREGVTHAIDFVPIQSFQEKDNDVVIPNDKLLSYYKSADIFVSSSLVEGFSLVCVEALAAGLPMVLTKCPGNEDLFDKDEQGGLYCRPRDAKDLAEKVIRLAKNSELREKFKKYNLEHARKYALDKIAQHYLDQFQDLQVR